MKDLAIIIVNWNTKALLRNCLHSVIQETRKYTYDIFVVDNNSPDNSAAMVKNEFPQVKLIANLENRGFAAANNQALKISNAKNYLLLNPDTEILDGALDKMIDFINESTFDIVTCKLINSDGSLQKSVGTFYSFWRTIFENRFSNIIFEKLKLKQKNLTTFWNHDSICEIDWSRGAVVLFSKKVLEIVGLLDERFFIYGEEIDFFYRAKQQGFKAVYTPDAEIIHHGKASSKQRKAEMFIQNYKSFYLFLKKHYNFHSYFIYRLRVYFLLIAWLSYYYVANTLFKNKEENNEQLEVYSKTFLWHLSRESF